MQRYRKIDFMCIGFAKCGTTTLYNILNQHPDIFLSGIKEPVFWNERKDRGVAWYLHRYYKEAKRNQIIGEVNPQLTNGSVSLINVKKCLQDNAKIILMMRNPVERLYSHFFMQLLWRKPKLIGKNCIWNLEHYDRLFEDFIRNEINNMRRNWGSTQTIMHKGLFNFGNYVDWMQECIEVFGYSNIYPIIFEEFIQDKRKNSDQIFSLLGVRRNLLLDYDLKSNEGNFLPRNRVCMYINRMWYFGVWPKICVNVDINKSIDRFMDTYLNWNVRENTLLLKRVDRKDMTMRSRQLLFDLYMPEIEKLEVVLKKSLENLWY